MSKDRRYSRKVSGIERYNIVLNEIHRYNVVGVFEGEGELDHEAWIAAVAKAAEANPGTRVRLKSFLGFSRWVDSGIAPEVSYYPNLKWDGESEIGATFLEKKFDVLAGDAVFDVVLLPGKPNRVVVRGVHAVVDARGLLHMVKDVFRVLDGKEPIGSHSTMIDSDVREKFQDKIPKSETDNAAEQSSKACKAEKKEKPVEPQFLPVIEPGMLPDRYHYLVRKVEVPRTGSNLMPKLAQFLAEYARKKQDGPVAFTFTVDFRGLRVPVETTGNLTGYIRIPVEETDKPRDIMKRLYGAIRRYEDCQNPFILKLLPWLPFNFLIKQCRKSMSRLLYTANKDLPTGGIVSLGKFDFSEYACEQFQTKIIHGIPGSVGKFNAVICEGDEVATIIFSVPEAFNTNGQFDQLVQAFRDAMVAESMARLPEQRRAS